MEWIYVAKLEEIPLRGARVIRIGTEAIGIFRTSDDEVFALKDSCPHHAGPLSQGIVHGHCVTCPLHDWVIDLRSGQATGPDEGATQSFPVSVDDNRVYISMAGVSAENLDSDDVTAVGQ